jgi:hypothetical protein
MFTKSLLLLFSFPFLLLFSFLFEKGSHCAVQASLELMTLCLSLPSAGITDMYHHAQYLTTTEMQCSKDPQ